MPPLAVESQVTQAVSVSTGTTGSLIHPNVSSGLFHAIQGASWELELQPCARSPDGEKRAVRPWGDGSAGAGLWRRGRPLGNLGSSGLGRSLDSSRLSRSNNLSANLLTKTTYNGFAVDWNRQVPSWRRHHFLGYRRILVVSLPCQAQDDNAGIRLLSI